MYIAANKFAKKAENNIEMNRRDNMMNGRILVEPLFNASFYSMKKIT